MKKMYKAMALVLCAALLVAGSIFGTLAYLQMTTGSVTNTFTVGNVTITLDETPVDLYGKAIDGDRIAATTNGTAGNRYKLIPGREYTKDPTITVGANSEDCWVFAKLEDGLDEASIIAIDNTKWTNLGDGIYAYNTQLTAGGTAKLFDSFKFAETANPTDYENATIKITGYAVQAYGFDDAEDAWSQTFGKSTNG